MKQHKFFTMNNMCVFIYTSTITSLCSSVVCSSMEHLDIDPELAAVDDVYSKPRSRIYHEYSDGESNYSDSELLLSIEQKRLSRKSKRTSCSSSQRSSAISCFGYHRSISERALSFGNNVDKPSLPINKLSARSANYVIMKF